VCFMRICDYKFAVYGFFAEHDRTLAELAAGRCVHDRYHLTRIAAKRDQLHHGG
jgi:hypothetical protein